MTTVGRGGVETTQHWPQRRWGLGDGLTEFAAQAASDPAFAAAWGEIQTQLDAEGADLTTINAAKDHFVSSLEQMASTTIGVTGAQALEAAKQYVLVGQTIMGASQTIQGLIQTAETGNFPTIMSAFTGTLISLATTTGALTAGLGACVVGIVAGLIDILQNAGFFGAPSTDVEIQGCGEYFTKPTYMVGCVSVASYSRPIQTSPGTLWRAFPDKGNNVDPVYGPNQTDPDGYRHYSDYTIWYTVNGGGAWQGCNWEGPGGTPDHPDRPNKRLIDLAYPDFALIEPYETGNDFQKAFCKAWKANAEYALNGLKLPGDPAHVLVQVLRMWNRSHAGPPAMIHQSANDYISSLVVAAVSYLGSDPLIAAPNALYINTGAAVSVPNKVTLRLGTAAAKASASGFTNLSTGGKVAVVGASVTGAALVGTAIVAFVKGQAVDAVLSHVWKRLTGKR